MRPFQADGLDLGDRVVLERGALDVFLETVGDEVFELVFKGEGVEEFG